MALNKPIVGMAATPDGGGYWLVASDGGIFTFGDAHFCGSTGAIKLNKPIVGMTPTPDGKGYWLVASDGGIFAFGDAQFYGSTGTITLNKPIVGMSATADGNGYWLVASDGGIFAYGDAAFWGSTGNIDLNKPIVSMITGPTGLGYILVAADGGTFSFGTAPFYGSLGGIPLKNPIVTATATPGDTGYWFSDNTGEVSAFGQASYYGSAPSGLTQPIVGMAEAPGTGAFVGAPFPSGSYGFDVSKFTMNSPTCTTGLPTGLHDIGVVEVDGAYDPGSTTPGYPNPCLAAEAQWAGAGLNLYYLPRQRRARHRRPLLVDRHLLPESATTPASTPSRTPRPPASTPTSPGGSMSRTSPTYWTVEHRRQRGHGPGRHRRAPQHRGHRGRRHLRQSRQLEPDRGQLPTVGSLLDGLLPPADRQRPRRLRGSGRLPIQVPTTHWPGRDRAVRLTRQRRPLRRGLRLLSCS